MDMKPQKPGFLCEIFVFVLSGGLGGRWAGEGTDHLVQ